MEDILIACYTPQGITNNSVDFALSNTDNHTLYSGYKYIIDSNYCYYGYFLEKNFLKIPQNDTNKRYIGLQVGTNLDGSKIVKLLTNDSSSIASRDRYQALYGCGCGYVAQPEAVIDQFGVITHYKMPLSSFTNVGADQGYYGFLDIPNYQGQNRGFSPLDQSVSGAMTSVTLGPQLEYYVCNDSVSWVEDYASDMTINSLDQCTNNYTSDPSTTVTFGINNFNRVDGSGRHTYTEGGTFKYTQWNIQKDIGGLENNIVGDVLTPLQDKLNFYYGETQQIAKASIDLGIPLNINLNNDKTLDGNYYFSNSAFGIDYFNLYITQSEADAIKYLQDGTIPPDATKKDLPVGHFPDTEPPTPPTPPPDDNVENNGDNIEKSRYAQFTTNDTIDIKGINWYRINRGNLEDFIDWFWYDMVNDWSALFFNAMTGLYGNLQNAVISIKKMHVKQELWAKSISATSGINIARYTKAMSDGTNLAKFKEQTVFQPVAYLDFSSVDKMYKFLYYSPYSSLSLYLPYVGIVPIDINLLMDKKGLVSCIADPYSGSITYTISVWDGNNTSGDLTEYAVVATFQGKCSIEVPFSLDSSLDVAANVLQSVASAGVGMALGGTVAGATNLLGQDWSAPINSNTTITNNLNCYLPKRVAIVQQIPRWYKLYQGSSTINDFSSQIGFKFNSTRQLSLGMGYVEVKNPHYDNWETTPTKEEIEEIYRLMTEGIIL